MFICNAILMELIQGNGGDLVVYESRNFPTDIHTYIIGHYNPSVTSHATYIVCVNIIHMWWDLQFKVDSARQIF